MMTGKQRFGIALICAGVAAALVIPPLLRGASPASPATDTPRAEALRDDLKKLDKEYSEAIPTMMMLGDATFRKDAAPKAIPVLSKMAATFAQLEKTDPVGAKEYRTRELQLLAFAAALGDTDSARQLEVMAKSKDDYAVTAQSDLMLSRWIMASSDAAAQAKVLDDITPLAKDNADNKDLADTLNFMANIGGASNDVTKKAIEVIRANVKTEDVTDLLSQLDSEQAQFAAQLQLVGKPLSFEARTSTGGHFNLADYKGKVVMLDFWATWCGPCIGELPNVKKAYKDYHDKGFEIVGISCDEGDGVLNDFTKKNEMTWVQLRETSQNEDANWHPLAKKYGVGGIPVMFLIDKQGIVRYVDARQDLETKIGKLVAETAK